jgi:predicted ATPase
LTLFSNITGVEGPLEPRNVVFGGIEVPISKEVRLLANKWSSGQGWPKRLEWIEIGGIRGWSGQRIELDFPIVALVGENGVGKSTILQAIASLYKSNYYASEFFPDTAWDQIRRASITASIREGDGGSKPTSVRKPTNRWRGNTERNERPSQYIDLRRIQPISARTGYARLAKPQNLEKSGEAFDEQTLERLSHIMGRKYANARLAVTELDASRAIPVLQREDSTFSGFHGGAGETAMAELLRGKTLKYSILLIDEIETSLHPRVQRRLIRDLASLCREIDGQIVLTTHSPYVLEELPAEARIYIMDGSSGKRIIKGVSPEFAMTKMDEEPHPEAEIYTEDSRSAELLREIIISQDRELILRLRFIPFGAASVGRSLGEMRSRFPRPSLVFLDGDQEPSIGCLILPGEDAPERVVFEGLKKKNWHGISERTGRSPSDVIDACDAAMTLANHHDWVKYAADRLVVGGAVLWQALCAEWAKCCLHESHAKSITDAVKTVLGGHPLPESGKIQSELYP